MIFGNMKAAAFGDKGDMRVAQFESGSFGGKEIALSDQRGIVYKHRHAFVVSFLKLSSFYTVSVLVSFVSFRLSPIPQRRPERARKSINRPSKCIERE